MEKTKIGTYNKKVEGKLAVLLEEVQFYNSFLVRSSRKVFPPGTKVLAVHEINGTGLTLFKFKHNGRYFEHVVREGKFRYL